MGFAGPLMMAAGTGLSALSTYRQGQYASQQAEAQARMFDMQAMTAETNAEAIRQKSIFDQLRALKAGERRVGALRVGETEENIGDVVAEQAFENALDVALIGYEVITQAGRLKSQAAMYRYGAATQRAAGKYAERAGKIGAWTELLGGLGNMFLLTGFGSGGSPGTVGPSTLMGSLS